MKPEEKECMKCMAGLSAAMVACSGPPDVSRFLDMTLAEFIHDIAGPNSIQFVYKPPQPPQPPKTTAYKVWDLPNSLVLNASNAPVEHGLPVKSRKQQLIDAGKCQDCSEPRGKNATTTRCRSCANKQNLAKLRRSNRE